MEGLHRRGAGLRDDDPGGIVSSTRTIDRYALNDLLTAYLDTLGWQTNDEEDERDLNELVHVCADAIEEVLNGRQP